MKITENVSLQEKENSVPCLTQLNPLTMKTIPISLIVIDIRKTMSNKSTKLNYVKTSQKRDHVLIVRNVSSPMDSTNWVEGESSKDGFIELRNATHFGTRENALMDKDANLCMWSRKAVLHSIWKFGKL